MCKRHRKGLLGLTLAAASVLAFASPAGAVPVTNACKNSVTANNTELPTDTAGNAPASVGAGAPFTLSGIQQQVSVPGAVFVTGYNLGFLSEGANNIPISVRTVIEATNTVQGSQSTSTVGGSPPDGSLTVSTTINDPDDTPGTMDETATDGVGNIAYPAMNWTAGPSGVIDFREDTVTPLAANVGGIIVNAAVLPQPLPPVQFRCSPGTVTGPAPGVISFIDPAATFASTQIQTTTATTKKKKCKKKKKKSSAEIAKKKKCKKKKKK